MGTEATADVIAALTESLRQESLRRSAAEVREHVPDDGEARRRRRYTDRWSMHTHPECRTEVRVEGASVVGGDVKRENLIDVLDGTPVIAGVVGREGAFRVCGVLAGLDEVAPSDHLDGLSASASAYVFVRPVWADDGPHPATEVVPYDALRHVGAGGLCDGGTLSQAVGYRRHKASDAFADVFGSGLRRARVAAGKTLLRLADDVHKMLLCSTPQLLDVLAAWENGACEPPHRQSRVVFACAERLGVSADDLFAVARRGHQSASHIAFCVCDAVERAAGLAAVKSSYATSHLWSVAARVDERAEAQEEREKARAERQGRAFVQEAPAASRAAAVVAAGEGREAAVTSVPPTPPEMPFVGDYVLGFEAASGATAATGRPEAAQVAEPADVRLGGDAACDVLHRLGLRLPNGGRVVRFQPTHSWTDMYRSVPVADLRRAYLTFRAHEGGLSLPGRVSGVTVVRDAPRYVFAVGRATLTSLLASASLYGWETDRKNDRLARLRSLLAEESLPQLLVVDDGEMRQGVAKPLLPDGVVLLYRIGDLRAVGLLEV